jgi:hypothetical protein
LSLQFLTFEGKFHSGGLPNYCRGKKEKYISCQQVFEESLSVRVTFSWLKLSSPPLLLTPVKLFNKTIPQVLFRLSNV